MTFDTLSGITFGFMLVPFVAYVAVVYLQWGYANNDNYRQTVLATRTAMFLPSYALYMWLCVLSPNSFPGISVLINLMEGYSFYVFFSLIIYNLGGPAATLDAMTNSGKEYFCCTCCFPGEDKATFFRRNGFLQFHMLTTRVVFTILAAIASYSDSRPGKAAAVVFQFCTAAIVMTMSVHLVNLYEMIYMHTTNMSALPKFFLLKFSVAMIVTESLICQILLSTDNSPYSSDDGDDNYDTEDKTTRGLCALVLLELVALSIYYVYAYGLVKITPSTAPGFDGSDQPKRVEHVALATFLYDVWTLTDVWGTHALKSDLSAPLTKSVSKSSSSGNDVL